MKIVCLVKQVPHPESIEFDEETKSLKREGVPLLLNPFDRHAVLAAVALREREGGEVVAITMGPPSAEEALGETLALGADRGIHLSDRLFAVADTIGTSRTLALAVEKEGADLVLCGRKTVDAETWQVPPEVAGFLGWPHLTSVLELEPAGELLRARRETDEGEETYELPLPAVVSLARAEPEDRGERAGGAGRIAVWAAADLVPDAHPGDKRFGQPGSPTRVMAVRDAKPERAGAVFATPEEAAARVRELLTERRPSPPPWEKPAHIAEQPGRAYDCWTAVELLQGRPSRASLELVGKGRDLAGKLGGRNVALALGHGLDEAARELVRYGAELVHSVDDERLAEYHPELWAAAVRQVVERHQPHVLLIPASLRGREYGPRVAGELELGMTADCVDVNIAKAGRLLQMKPAYGGNIVSVILGRTSPQLATVRPRMFEPLEPRDDAEGEIQRLDLNGLPTPRARLLERRPGTEQPASELDEADVVVCLGLEVGGPEEIARIEAVAGAVGAAVGGTREVCEAGWLPGSRQIGLYGRAVAPRLLVAVGVHGDFDHLSGFVKAGVIVAISAAADAPMLAAADAALVGDWRALLLPLHELIHPHL